MDQYTITSGTRTACLDFTIESDSLFENTESLTGFLRGAVLSGTLTENPQRITFEPRETTIEITDDGNDGEPLHQKSILGQDT